jgi:hypothetical protein
MPQGHAVQTGGERTAGRARRWAVRLGKCSVVSIDSRDITTV